MCCKNSLSLYLLSSQRQKSKHITTTAGSRRKVLANVPHVDQQSPWVSSPSLPQVWGLPSHGTLTRHISYLISPYSGTGQFWLCGCRQYGHEYLSATICEHFCGIISWKRDHGRKKWTFDISVGFASWSSRHATPTGSGNCLSPPESNCPTLPPAAHTGKQPFMDASSASQGRRKSEETFFLEKQLVLAWDLCLTHWILQSKFARCLFCHLPAASMTSEPQTPGDCIRQ